MKLHYRSTGLGAAALSVLNHSIVGCGAARRGPGSDGGD